MAHINLLPWRENLRKQQQRQFGFMAIGAVVLTIVVMLYWHFFNQGLIDHQKNRNRLLEREIALVDKQIKEIEQLEKTKAKLIARMEIIQDLQTSRPQIVHLIDEIVETLPGGAYLAQIKQSGGSITLDGHAQSNARVSAFMRNIDASSWLSNARLKIINKKANKSDSAGMNKFTLFAKQVNPAKVKAQAE